MNPLKWVRWKVVIVLAVLGGALYFLGLNPLARWQINDLGGARSRTRWSVGDVDLGLLQGSLNFADVLVSSLAGKGGPKAAAPARAAGPASSKEEVFRSALATFDLSVDSLLRRRFVVDRIELSGPRMRIERRPDGSTNLSDLGTEEEAGAEEAGPAAEPAEPTDWSEAAKKWYERVQSIREKLASKKAREGEGAKAAPGEGEEGAPVDPYEARATYPFAAAPRVVVKEIVASDLQIDLEESTATTGASPLSLENGHLAIHDLSDRPSLHGEPLRFDVGGDLSGGKLSLEGTIDLTGDLSEYEIEFKAAELPASIVGRLVGESLPVELSAGRVSVLGKLRLDGEEKLDIGPKLVFRGVRLKEKPGRAKVAGVDARKFVQAFNEASKALGEAPLEVADLRITGTLSRPRFEWGDTVKNLVVQGGKAFVESKVGEVKDRVREEAGKHVDRLEDEMRGRVGGLLDKGLGDTPAARDLRDKVKGDLEGLIPGGESAGKSGAGAIDGLKDRLFSGFGSGGKKAEKNKKKNKKKKKE